LVNSSEGAVAIFVPVTDVSNASFVNWSPASLKTPRHPLLVPPTNPSSYTPVIKSNFIYLYYISSFYTI